MSFEALLVIEFTSTHVSPPDCTIFNGIEPPPVISKAPIIVTLRFGETRIQL